MEHASHDLDRDRGERRRSQISPGKRVLSARLLVEHRTVGIRSLYRSDGTDHLGRSAGSRNEIPCRARHNTRRPAIRYRHLAPESRTSSTGERATLPLPRAEVALGSPRSMGRVIGTPYESPVRCPPVRGGRQLGFCVWSGCDVPCYTLCICWNPKIFCTWCSRFVRCGLPPFCALRCTISPRS